MANSIAIGYNTGSTIDGTIQVGNLAIQESPKDYGSSPNGVVFWGSPDLDEGYVIAREVPSGNQPNPLSVPAYVGFWGTKPLKTEQSFINLSEYVSRYAGNPQTFASGNDAKTWLNANGYWTSYVAVTPTPTPSSVINVTPTITTSITPTNTITSTIATTPTPTPTPTTPVYLGALCATMYYEPNNTYPANQINFTYNGDINNLPSWSGSDISWEGTIINITSIGSNSWEVKDEYNLYYTFTGTGQYPYDVQNWVLTENEARASMTLSKNGCLFEMCVADGTYFIGVDSINGRYTSNSGYFGGKLSYTHDNQLFGISYNSDQWVLEAANAGIIYYSSENVEYPSQVTTWTATEYGTTPPPTIISGACPTVTVCFAGDSQVNGLYTYAGVSNGKNYYISNTDYRIEWDTNQSRWSIYIGDISIPYYYSTEDTEFPYQVLGWDFDSGIFPAPTVVQSTQCPSLVGSNVCVTNNYENITGTYIISSYYGGKPFYSKNVEYTQTFILWRNNQWQITSFDNSVLYYSTNNVSYPYQATTWQLGALDDLPTVTEGDCV